MHVLVSDTDNALISQAATDDLLVGKVSACDLPIYLPNSCTPQVADVMHSLFTTHGTMLLPFFDKLLPTFSDMLVRFSKNHAACAINDFAG